MASKEEIKIACAKWTWLLENLSRPKHIQYKLTQILEKIQKHNPERFHRLLLPIAYRVFAGLGDMKLTKSCKNSYFVCEFTDDILLAYNELNAHAEMVKKIAEIIISAYKEAKLTKISHLELDTDGTCRKLYIKY
jgi:hypothetical protein